MPWTTTSGLRSPRASASVASGAPDVGEDAPAGAGEDPGGGEAEAAVGAEDENGAGRGRDEGHGVSE
jgi:hypothetical protein